MTLAMAWRSEGRLHLAADSRIKLGENKFADVGIKVIAVPVVVRGTDRLDASGNPSVIFDQTYGLAYAGSFVNAGTFSELIAELLQDVQYVSQDKPLEFLTFCEFLLRYSSRISTEICAYMEKHGRYEFFFVGFCPRAERLRAAKFEFEYQAGVAKPSFTEVLEQDGEYLVIGSGAKAATEGFKAPACRDSMLLLLNDVIDRQVVESVGGDIQYGSFLISGGFQVQGIARISMETTTHEGRTYGPTSLRLHKYRGFQLYDNWDPMEQPLWVSPGFVELKVPPNAASTAYFRRSLGLPEDM